MFFYAQKVFDFYIFLDFKPHFYYSIIRGTMLDYSKVIQNSKAFKTIDLDISRSRLSHVYLFVNADENYLKSFACIVAKKFINLNETEFVEKNNSRIDKRIHPDVIFYGEDKQIDVSAVADIVESSSVSPFETDKKIFVLLNAQKMNEASQNKILKSIEEPPKNTFYLICATSITKTLPTILSRVKKVELDELTAEDISSMLEEKGVEKQKADILSSCSNGNASFAEKLATDDGFIEFFNSIVSCLFEINGSRDVLKFSNLFSAKTVDKEEFINISMLLLRDIMMILSKKEELVVCKNVLAKLKVISAGLNLSGVQGLITACLEEKKKLAFNVNTTAVVDDFLFKYAEVKVKCRRLSV